MSTEVIKLVVHYVDKRDEQAHIHLRNDEIPHSERVDVFMSQLHQAFTAKPGKGYCAFSAEKNSIFASNLVSYQNQDQSFYGLTAAACDVLKEELNKYAFHETGYLVFCHYRHVASEYLMVALVNIKDHYTITNELDLAAAKHLDIAKMQLAARIDLTAMQTDSDAMRYISFIKGRAGRKVADFFLDFLGCEEGIDPKQQSKVMLDAVEDFMATQGFDKSEKDALRKDVFDYCQDCVTTGDEAQISTLSDTLSEKAEGSFSDFYQNQGYELEESFPVDKKTVTSMVKFSGVGGGVSVSFERKHLGERVYYDAANDTLTIKGLPANLKDQLMQYINGQ